MKTSNKKRDQMLELRKKAEKLVKKKEKNEKKSIKEIEYKKITHELEVHQVELQMQNEEMRIAKNETDSLLEKYTLLYDFAPIGYITLTPDCEISECNFRGAMLLGHERFKIIGRNFRFFIASEYLIEFNNFFKKVFSSTSKQSIELKLRSNKKPEDIFVLIEAISSVDNRFCLLMLLDITERKSSEDTILNYQKVLEERISRKKEK